MTRYQSKEFRVILSEEIPGKIFKIETFTKDTKNKEDIIRETLTYQGTKTNKELRQIYNKEKESKL